jgi:rubrerythrin
MAVFFKSGELYRMAGEMERTGYAYYNEIANSTSDAAVKTVFQYLASAEKRHLRTFKRLWHKAPKSSPPESYRGEYKNYLAALLKDQVFSTSAVAKSRAARSSIVSSLNTGIKAEKDSILFYSGLLDIVHADHIAAIGKILAEEKRHLRKLMDYKYKSGCFK